MTLQDYLTLGNIIITFIVGVVLFIQIKSQKSIIDSYKDFVSVINPKTALLLKDDEIMQLKKNMSNDIQILQNQVSELSNYVEHVIDYAKTLAIENDVKFDKETFVRNNLPSCQYLLKD